MPSVNKVTIIGHLGKNPEIRTTQSGKKCASFSVATSDGYKEKSGQWQDKTEWHNIVIWNLHFIEVAEKHLHKGSKVYLEGALQTRKWTDKSNIERYTTEIVIAAYKGELQCLDKKETSETETKSETPVYDNTKAGGAGFDDDIPF